MDANVALDPGSLPTVSIIIPTLNEASFIGSTLDQIHEQSYPAHLVELLVVDGGSKDETCNLVRCWQKRRHRRVRLLTNPGKLSSRARNIGIAASSGDYVLFIDAHVFIPSTRLIEDMVVVALQERAMVLGRAQPLTAPTLSYFQATVAGVRNSRLGHSTKSFIYLSHEGWVSPVSIGVMYHRSIFSAVGYFDEHFDAAEDVEFNFRLEQMGYQAYISPRFKVLYYPRKNFYQLTKQMFRYGKGRAKFTGKHRKGFQAELCVPICVLLLALGVLSLALHETTLELFFILVMLGYGITLLTFLGSLQKKIHSLLAPICLLTIHVGLAVGLLTGALLDASHKKDK